MRTVIVINNQYFFNHEGQWVEFSDIEIDMALDFHNYSEAVTVADIIRYHEPLIPNDEDERE